MVVVDCVLSARARVGEGPIWSPSRRALWWVDISAGVLHLLEPSAGVDEQWPMPGRLGCVFEDDHGSLVLGLEDGFATFDPDTGALDCVGELRPSAEGLRLNDGVVTPQGELLATTMSALPPWDEPRGGVWRLDSTGCTTAVLGGLQIGNGLAFSPDGHTLYLSDTHPDVSAVWAYDWDAADRVATKRRQLLGPGDLPGRPDGAAVDEDGCYWIACAYGWAVARVTPAGKVDRVVDMPVEKPTKVAFGGDRLDTMFVTSIGANVHPEAAGRQPDAGGVFAFDPGVRGLATTPFTRSW